MKIMVIGGSGLTGAKLVAWLRGRGAEVVAASPRSGVDVITGQGLMRAMAGADATVDVTNSPSFEDEAVVEFFTRSTRNVLAAAQAVGVKHHVALSVVGAQRVRDSGYFRAKQAQQTLIEASATPYTILQSTQFFEFIERIAQEAFDGLVYRVSPSLMQPVSSDEVVSVLGDIVLGAARNDTAQVAGPEVLAVSEAVRAALNLRCGAAPMVTDPCARYFGAHRWRLGLAEGEPRYDVFENRLAEAPKIAVATITLEGDANGAPHPPASAYAAKFTGRYEHRLIEGGVGHNLPQEAPRAFADAVVAVDQL